MSLLRPTPPDALRVTARPVTDRVLLGLALMPLVAFGACAAGAVSLDTGLTLWLAGCALALVALVATIVRLVRKRVDPTWGWWTIVVAVVSPVASLIMGLATSGGFSRGRALRRRGRARTPEPDGSPRAEAWVEDGLGGEGEPLDAPAGVADGWRANAATEAASVAAFSHLAVELLAIGAPPSLVADAHADALDEIRHARQCYGIAAALDGRRVGPAPFAQAVLPRDRRPTALGVGVEAVVESCVLERASARVARHLAGVEGLPAGMREVLASLAVDEDRHADHGWAVFEWCAAQGGAAVHQAARRALERLTPRTMSGAVAHDDWERWGLAGPTLWRRSVAQARREALGRLEGRASAERRAA